MRGAVIERFDHMWPMREALVHGTRLAEIPFIATSGNQEMYRKLMDAIDQDNMDPEQEYASFEEKVKRTVYVDNFSPQVTEPVLRTALNQFGSVNKVQLIPNYAAPKNTAHCALVEMESAKQAKEIVSVMINFPFMMSGMPRPVRARPAVMEMFDDRPRKPGRTIQCRWLDPQDPDFLVAQKLKNVTNKHAAEASFLLECQLEEEEKLAYQQTETLKTNHKKFELVDGVTGDGTVNRLARRYNFRI